MSWKEADNMSEKVKFISSYLEEEESFSELCEIFSISRKTGYKWVKRYEDEGVAGLYEQSRARHYHPNATPEHIVEKILKVRCRHPTWGPKKLNVILSRQNPGTRFPAESTIGEILKRNNMIKARRQRKHSSPHREPLREYAHPNSVWCADFKGDFPVDGKRCRPLTISDGYSRYLLSCKALKSSCHGPSSSVFKAAFREFGLPEAIRTDNGSPFSTVAPAGLSRLAIWWIRLGIVPERIMPARPDQNGRHERMHRTLKAETARPPRSSFRAQQRAFDNFRKEYNEVRPHEALDQGVPASLYEPSLRPYPRKLPQIEYPDFYQVQKVYPNGVISFNGVQWYVSAAVRGEWLGLEQVSDDRWKVYFGKLLLGIADLRNAKKKRYRKFAHLVPTGQDACGWHGKPATSKRGKKV